MAALLLARGADPALQDQEGRTAARPQRAGRRRAARSLPSRAAGARADACALRPPAGGALYFLGYVGLRRLAARARLPGPRCGGARSARGRGVWRARARSASSSARSRTPAAILWLLAPRRRLPRRRPRARRRALARAPRLVRARLRALRGALPRWRARAAGRSRCGGRARRSSRSSGSSRSSSRCTSATPSSSARAWCRSPTSAGRCW